MNLQVLELSLAILGIKLHILVWSYWEDEVGHGDATAIYEEFNRRLIYEDINMVSLLAIEIAYEILGSTTTKPAARVDIHGHHPLHLLITIYRQSYTSTLPE